MKAKRYFFRKQSCSSPLPSDDEFMVPSDEKWRFLTVTSDHYAVFICWKIDPAVDMAGIVWQCS